MSLRIILAYSLVALGVAACTPRAGGDSGKKVPVVASFFPLAEAAQEVGGQWVDVTNLTAPGVEPHDLELTSIQLEAISTAKVVLYLGGGFQPAVQDAIVDAQGTTLDVSEGLRSLAVPPGDQGTGLSADPHVWLDPALFSQIVQKVEVALAKADPAHAADFAKRSDAFRARLAALDSEYRQALSSCKRNVIVTSHAAFGYLAKRYGLTQEAISGLSPEAEPDPRRLAQLKALVQRDGVTTIFTETLVSPKVAQTLAQEAGATTAVLDPLESLTSQEMAEGEDYISVMQKNLETLRTALGCS